MSLFRSFELLRAPDGEGAPAGGSPTLVVEAAPAIAPAGPLTVAPEAPPAAPAVEAAPAAPVVTEAPAAPAAEAPAAVAAQPEIPVGGLLSTAPSRAELKAKGGLAPPNPDLPAPVVSGEPAVDAVPAKQGTAVEPATPEKTKKTYEAFKLPEGVKVDEKRLKKFTDILEASDPQPSQKDAQAYFDLHIEELQLARAEKEREGRTYWANLQDQWREETRKDPKLGRSLEYNLAVAKAVIEDHASKEDQARLFAAMDANGFVNFAPFIRLMNTIGGPEVLNVFEDSIVPAQAPIGAAVQTRADKWYGGNGNQKPSGAP